MPELWVQDRHNVERAITDRQAISSENTSWTDERCTTPSILKIPGSVSCVPMVVASPPPSPSKTGPERGDAVPRHDTKHDVLYMICDKDCLDAVPPNGSEDPASATPATPWAALALWFSGLAPFFWSTFVEFPRTFPTTFGWDTDWRILRNHTIVPRWVGV